MSLPTVGAFIVDADWFFFPFLTQVAWTWHGAEGLGEKACALACSVWGPEFWVGACAMVVDVSVVQHQIAPPAPVEEGYSPLFMLILNCCKVQLQDFESTEMFVF